MKSIIRWMLVFVAVLALVGSVTGCQPAVGQQPEAPAVVQPVEDLRAKNMENLRGQVAELQTRVSVVESRAQVLEAQAKDQAALTLGLANLAAEDRKVAARAETRATIVGLLAIVLAGFVWALVRHTAMPVNPVPRLNKVLARHGRDLRPKDRTFTDTDLNKVPAARAAATDAPSAGGSASARAEVDPLRTLADGAPPASLGDAEVITA